MNIAICLNHDFLMLYGVMLQSLCVTNSDERLGAYVITDSSFSDEDKKIYSDIVCGHGRNNELHVIYVKDKQIETFTKISNSRYPIQVFYRLLIGELLPETVERVLYLDGAIIVRKSLRNLWPFDLENVDVGAVPDAMSVMLSYYNRLQYSMKKGYVNAGGCWSTLSIGVNTT